MSGLTFRRGEQKVPYGSYNFRAEFVGPRRIYRAGFAFISGIQARAELVQVKEGGVPAKHQAIREVTYNPITFERGFCDNIDLLRAFAAQFDVMQGGMMLTNENNFTTIKIERMDRSGIVYRTEELQDVIVTAYETSDLNAMSTSNAIERLTVEFRHVDIVQNIT